MPNLRITVPLDDSELQALMSMAARDCRHPREQLRFLLREEARRCGLLSDEGEAQPTSEVDRSGFVRTEVTA